MTEVTIYHNPACGTSRNVLGLIRNSGVEPRVMGIDGQQSIAELGYLTLRRPWHRQHSRPWRPCGESRTVRIASRSSGARLVAEEVAPGTPGPQN